MVKSGFFESFDLMDLWALFFSVVKNLVVIANSVEEFCINNSCQAGKVISYGLTQQCFCMFTDVREWMPGKLECPAASFCGYMLLWHCCFSFSSCYISYDFGHLLTLEEFFLFYKLYAVVVRFVLWSRIVNRKYTYFLLALCLVVSEWIVGLNLQNFYFLNGCHFVLCKLSFN